MFVLWCPLRDANSVPVLQSNRRVDFSDNPMSEPTFEFYDKTLLDEVKRGNADVQEFFRLLSVCHTVMPEYKDGTLLVVSGIAV